MKTKQSEARHRIVVEMDTALLKVFHRVVKKMHATSLAGAIRQLIVAEEKRGK